MELEDVSERANELVRAYIVRHYLAENPGGHLGGCDQVTVEDAAAEDGGYGCDTGCEYVRFTAVLACPHGSREEHGYGEFGDLAGIIEDLESEADRVQVGGGE